MNSKLFTTNWLLILIAFTSVTLAVVDDADKQECMKMSKGMLKRFMKLYSACNKELGMLDKSADDYKDSLGCVIKCVMKKSGILDAEDLVTAEILKSKIEEHIPEKFRVHAHEGLAKCSGLHDALDAKDPKCKSYMTLGNCMQEALVDLCGEMPMI